MRTSVIILFTLLVGCRTSNSKDEYKGQVKRDTTNLIPISAPTKKFESNISFDDFRVDTFKGKKSPINYNSSKTANRFRTVITENYNENGVMFGGHFSFVRWGCGTACKSGAIVDLRDGKVYDVPTAELDYSYQKNSSLLIINPPDSLGFYEDCGYCSPRLWIWKDDKKRFEQYDKAKN